MPVLNPGNLIENRLRALREFHRSLDTPRAQLDVSGGVDSAVMLALLARALGPDRITAVHSRIDTNPEATSRAEEVAAAAGVPLNTIDLSELFHRLVADAVDSLVDAGHARHTVEARIAADPTVLGSIRSTLRAPVGRAFNRLTGDGVRHGTGNECEDRWLRFYQKGGDGEVDTNPLEMLSKAEVYQLAVALGLPRSVLAAPPSPDLWGPAHQHDDEEEIASWLRLPPGSPPAYGSVDPDTGEYLRVGLLERVSRFADQVDDALFAESWDEGVVLASARASAAFTGLPGETIDHVVRAARTVERATRHKANPNLPSLGGRSELVAAGILVDTLPLLTSSH